MNIETISIYMIHKRIVMGLCMVLFQVSCKESGAENKIIVEKFDYSINTNNIPKDTVNFTDDKVTYINGLYFLDNKKYSGIVFKELKGYNVKTYGSVLKGKLHGTYRSFYKNGSPYEIRQYKNNYAVGKQYGYWEETGNLKFEYNYYNQKKEGIQKSWYKTGEPFYVYNYKNDRQEGMQQAWRINGSLYRNFEARNGSRYGLQKSISCTELSNEVVITSRL
jgi:antitoxin component YwqK of YwqJK toxin-antitoxin module